MKKTLLFFVACICLAMNAQAQTGVVRYTDNTQYNKAFHKMIPTSDGGVLVVGGAGYEGIACKFSSNLNMIWSYSMDSIFFRDVIETNDGNYVLYGDLMRANVQNDPICVVKLNPSGSVLFEKHYYDPNTGTGLTSVGLCEGSGSDQGFLLFGGACMAGQYILKCDVNGNIVWEKNNIGAGAGAVMDLIVDGNDYVGCFSYSNSSMLHAGIFRLNAAGALTASRGFYSANTMQYLTNSVVKLNSGNFALVTPFASGMGLAVYNVDPAFTSVTCNQIAFSSAVYMSGFFATATDDLVICGSYSTGAGTAMKVNAVSGTIAFANYTATVSAGFASGMQLSNGDYAFCGSKGYLGGVLAEVSPSGTGLCSSLSYQPTSSAYTFTNNAMSISQVTLGAGISSYSYTFDPITFTSNSLCGNVSTEELPEQTEQFSAFPNPAQNTITVSADEMAIETIRILNIAGQEIQQISTQGQKTVTLDLSAIASGVYFIEINSADQKMIRRIVRE